MKTTLFTCTNNVILYSCIRLYNILHILQQYVCAKIVQSYATPASFVLYTSPTPLAPAQTYIIIYDSAYYLHYMGKLWRTRDVVENRLDFSRYIIASAGRSRSLSSKIQCYTRDFVTGVNNKSTLRLFLQNQWIHDVHYCPNRIHTYNIQYKGVTIAL